MSVSSRPRASSALLLLLLLTTTAMAADRIRPSVPSNAWSRHAQEDLAWADRWPSDWLRHEALATARGDTLRLLIDQATAGAAFAVGEEPASPAAVSWSQRLRERWHRRGHLMAEVLVRGGEADPHLRVDPGPVFEVGEVIVDGDRTPRVDAWLERWLPRQGDRCDQQTWTRAVSGLLRAAGDAGHPFAGWSVRDILVDPESRTVDVRASFSPGASAIWGPVTSTLSGDAAHRHLVRSAGIRSGQPFREGDLDAARRRLMGRGTYRTVGEPVVFVSAAAGTVGVHWPVTLPARPNRMALMLGLSRPDNEQGTRISGQADILLGNIAGTGRRLELAWSDNGDDRSHFGFQWREPMAAGTPLDVVAALDQEIVADVHSRLRLDMDLSLALHGAWAVELGMGRDRSTFPEGAWIRSGRWRTRGALRHRRLDRLVSGWDGLFSVESARRSAALRPETEEAEASILQEERQTIVKVDFDGELLVRRALGFGLRGHYAGVAGDDDVVPLVEQYRLGGARSLRGYREDQFHGEQVASLALELRLGAPGRSRVYTFLDLGYVRQSRRDPATDAVVTATDRPRGFGLGIETAGAGGDVSLAIGFPGSVGFDEAKLHVSLQQTF